MLIELGIGWWICQIQFRLCCNQLIHFLQYTVNIQYFMVQELQKIVTCISYWKRKNLLAQSAFWSKIFCSIVTCYYTTLSNLIGQTKNLLAQSAFWKKNILLCYDFSLYNLGQIWWAVPSISKEPTLDRRAEDLKQSESTSSAFLYIIHNHPPIPCHVTLQLSSCH